MKALAPLGKAAATTITLNARPASPTTQPSASTRVGSSRFFKSAKPSAARKWVPTWVCTSVIPTSSSAMGPKALPSNCSGLSTRAGNLAPVCANSSPAAIGSGTGWMMALRAASQTVRPMCRCPPLPGTAASRAAASSSTIVAMLNTTRACSEISGSKVARPASP